MRLAVFRTIEDGRRTAQQLGALGHTAILAPVIDIVATGEPIPDKAGILVFTSAHAISVLDPENVLPRFGTTPCYCVGARTAAAAKAFGFKNVRSPDADAVSLAAMIVREVDPTSQAVLLTAPDRKPVLENILSARSFALSVVEVYQAKPVRAWPTTVVSLLSGEACDGALHYSRRNAEIAFELADAISLQREIRSWHHYCLSADVAEALRLRDVSRVTVAGHPDEKSILRLLEKAAVLKHTSA